MPGNQIPTSVPSHSCDANGSGSQDSSRRKAWRDERIAGEIDYVLDPRCSSQEFYTRYRVLLSHMQAGEIIAPKIFGHLFDFMVSQQALSCTWEILASDNGLVPEMEEWWGIEVLGQHKAVPFDHLQGFLRSGGNSCREDLQIDSKKDANQPTAHHEERPSVVHLVEKAAILILNPYLDTLLGDSKWDVRSRLDTFDVLARARFLTDRQDSGFWVCADLTEAISHVTPASLTKVLGTYIGFTKVVPLVNSILEQSALDHSKLRSPLGLMLINLYLYDVLDQRWRKLSPRTHLLRRGADLAILCRTKKEARESYVLLADLMSSGNLQECFDVATEGVRTLSERQPAYWLGYRIHNQPCRSNDKRLLAVRVGRKASLRFQRGLQATHDAPNSPLRAEKVIAGWLNFLGPCYKFEEHAAVYECFKATTYECGFEEILSTDDFMDTWKESWSTWQERNAQVVQDLETSSTH